MPTEDFLLRVIALQLDRDDPLDGLLEQALHHVVRPGRIELLGELLGDGAAAARVLLHQDAALQDGAEQGLGVDARVVGEAHVLRGDEGMDEVGRQFVVAHVDAVLLTIRIGAQGLPVGGQDFGGKLVVGILQVLHRRHVANPSLRDGIEHDHAGQHAEDEEYPQGNYDFLYHGSDDAYFIGPGKDTNLFWNTPHASEKSGPGMDARPRGGDANRSY